MLSKQKSKRRTIIMHNKTIAWILKSKKANKLENLSNTKKVKFLVSTKSNPMMLTTTLFSRISHNSLIMWTKVRNFISIIMYLFPMKNQPHCVSFFASGFPLFCIVITKIVPLFHSLSFAPLNYVIDWQFFKFFLWKRNA